MDLSPQVAALARRVGVSFEVVHPLRSTNNVVLWLEPSDVVAKVHQDRGRAETELKVAAALAEIGAPVIPPAESYGSPVYNLERSCVTFWRYASQAGMPSPTSHAIGVALHDLHIALRQVGEGLELPAAEVEMQAVLGVLGSPGNTPELEADDRRLLQAALRSAVDLLTSPVTSTSTIHGAPHRNNILVVDGCPRFIDFETVCQGPVEWDLAHLEPEVAESYPQPVDSARLEACRLAVSAKTSAACWANLHRGADMQFHAEHHLAVVRSALT